VLNLQNYTSKEKFKVVKVLSFQEAESTFSRKWEIPISAEYIGSYAVVPIKLAREITQDAKNSDGNYIMVIGVLPVGMGSNGVPICEFVNGGNNIYLCEVHDRNFKNLPPLSFYAVTRVR